jgi:hypothetical protein
VAARAIQLHRLLIVGVLAGLGIFFILPVGFVGLVIYDFHVQRAYGAQPDTHDLTRQIDRMAGNYLAAHSNAAVVIAVYQHGRRSFQGFGKVSGSNHYWPDISS